MSTNLTPANTDDSIVQIETTDTWLGGAGNTANKQAQALLNKITYTRNTLMLQSWIGNTIVFVNSGSNTWQNKGSNNKAHYRKDTNQVFLSGLITNTAGSAPATSDILILPAAARPPYDVNIMVYTAVSGAVRMTISASTGHLTCGAGLTGDVYLDGISYKISADTY